MDRLLIKLPSLILLAEKTYSSGATKKETVIQACNSFLTPEQQVVLDPILSALIDLCVKLMSESAVLNKRFCFRNSV
jgi:hypothetical protein